MSRAILLGTTVALAGGMAVSFQAALLAHLGRAAGPARAGLATYVAGGALAALALLALRGGTASALAPRTLWLAAAGAGLLGVLIVTTIAYATGRVSVTAGLAVMLAGQLGTAMVLDAWGVGAPAVAPTLRRVAGLLVIGVGAWLMLPAAPRPVSPP
jgi:bacterial/archaeal transporter family-2 protein